MERHSGDGLDELTMYIQSLLDLISWSDAQVWREKVANLPPLGSGKESLGIYLDHE
jgi:hypothetical protein